MRSLRFLLSAFKPTVLSVVMGGVVGVGSLVLAGPSQAAQQVVLKYGFLRESIAVADLATLANTGQAPRQLNSYIRLANQDPKDVQQALTRQVRISPIVLDRVLNSPLGEAALDEVGKAIHTPAGAADRQALRAALVLSASQDGKLSLLETIQNYPTNEVHVEGERLVAAYDRLSALEQRVRKIFSVLDEL